jgi:hypothetical protein
VARAPGFVVGHLVCALGWPRHVSHQGWTSDACPGVGVGR